MQLTASSAGSADEVRKHLSTTMVERMRGAVRVALGECLVDELRT
jgi:hypothetical protein